MKFWAETFGQARSNWQLAGWLLAFAFPVLALVVDKAASTIFTIFALSGIWLLARGRAPKPSPEMRWVSIAFAAYFLVGVLSFFLGEQTRLGEKILGRDVRFLAAVLASLAVWRLLLPKRWCDLALATGGLVTGLTAIAQVAYSDQLGYRANGETISILFGHLAAGIALANAACAFYSTAWRGYIFLPALLFSVAAVVLSGTRGAILSLLVVFLLLLMQYLRGKGFHWSRLAAAMVAVVGLIGMIAIANKRVDDVLSEIVDYRQQDVVAQKIDWPTRFPACFNDANFLQWLVNNSVTSGSAQLEIGVRAAGNGTHFEGIEFPCPDDYLIVIRNPDKQHYGWIYLPQRSVPSEGYYAALVVKGRGELALARTPRENRIRVDTEDIQVVQLDSALSSDPQYLLLFAPGDELAFAPVISSESEYVFSNQTSSVGSRLLMWEGAMLEFFNSPAIGRGTGTFPSVLRERAEGGVSPWQLTEFDHAHNEILTIAAERGIIGLITLFGVYAAPFWLFWRRRDVFGVAGMAFVGSIFLSGLTETIFNHSLGITYYCMLVLLLATAPCESPDGDAPRADAPGNPLT